MMQKNSEQAVPILPEPPQAAVALQEEDVLEICRRLLKHPDFGVTDNFFDAGGNSLLAMSLMLELETRFGVTPNLETIFGAPTIRGLCRAIAGNAERKAASILPIRPGTSDTTFYVVHSAFDTAPLSAALRDDLALAYVLVNDPAWLHRQIADGKILEAVRHVSNAYADAIAARRHDAPFFLSGHSFGGVLAVETACRLEERGIRPEMVFLFDTYMYRAADRIIHEILQNRWLTRKFRQLLVRDKKTPEPATTIAQDYAVLREKASRTYRGPGRPLQCRTVLFRASLSPEGQPLHLNRDPGWGHVLGNRFSDVPVPGDHFSMLAEPYVGDLASEIDRQIRSSARSG